MSVYSIIQSIADTSSLNAKQAILEFNKGNMALREAFRLAENRRINFYIREDESLIAEPAITGRELTLEDIQKLLDLNNRVVTGMAARQFFQSILQPLNQGSRIVMLRILNRDLRCNAGTSLANKVWKGLIPEYPVMLASKFDEKAKKLIATAGVNGLISQMKSDGGRLSVQVDSEGNVTYHSRNGNELKLFGIFDAEFSQFKGRVFDGELVIFNESGAVSRKESNGIYTKAVRGTIAKEEASRFGFVTWDTVSMEDFVCGYSAVPYSTRLSELNCMVGKMSAGSGVSVVKTETMSTLDECIEFYDKMRAAGEEGSIIKFANMPWEDKRSKQMIKLKAEESADLLVVGVEEGSGKYAGMIGALVVETSCGKLRSSVGTGFDDEARSKDPSEYIGRIIEVAYNERITSKGRDTESLFLPVFKGIRYDKSVANSLKEMK